MALPQTAFHPALAPADQRVAGILMAARRAFAEKGFDGASMQDLARTTGMSVGNFYRYFPSKAAIVEAMIAGDLARMEQDFATILTAPAPMDALRAKIRSRIMLEECAADGQIWAEITAAALRKPEIGAAARRMETAIVSHLTAVFARATGTTPEAAMQRHGARASLIVMLVKACAMQPPERDALQEARTEMVLALIDSTLDAVAADVARSPFAGRPQ